MQNKNDMNYWADHWTYSIGATVIPANTREKTVSVNWKKYQKEPPTKEQYEQWKINGDFKNGMAVIAGKLWHNKTDLYLICVDLDNQLAIDEFCTRDGIKTPLEQLAKHIIIEQHKDQKDRAHVVFYSHHQFPKKSSDVVSKVDHTEIPLIEIKGAGEHGLLFVSPSPHKNGQNYEILGVDIPEIADFLYEHLQNILKKYSIQYPANGNNSTDKNTSNLVSIQDLFKPGTEILEGENRHEGLLRAMESLILRNQTILSPDKIRRLSEEFNVDHCKPSLEKREVEKQWRCAIKFVGKINKQRAFEQYQLEERQKRELVELELANSEERENEKKNPLRIGVLARLNEEGKNHYANGQLSSLGVLYKRVHSAYAKCHKCGRYKETVFLHPETKNYFLEHFGNGICMYRFKNSECGGVVRVEPRWVNALDTEISDTSSLQDIDRLKCILLGDDTKDVGIGENVTVLGSVYMESRLKVEVA